MLEKKFSLLDIFAKIRPLAVVTLHRRSGDIPISPNPDILPTASSSLQ